MIYLNTFSLSLLAVFLSAFAVKEEQTDLQFLSFLPTNLKGVFYADPARADREREPTTKRPLREERQNDNSEDYENSAEQKQEEEEDDRRINNPYPLTSNPRFFGFNNYPSNGVLVGPSGPTGIIGRPQQYPNTFLNYPLIDYPNFNNGYLAAAFPSHYGTQGSYPNQLYPASPFYTEGYGLVNNNNFLVDPFPYLRSNINNYDERANEAEGKNLTPDKTNQSIDNKFTKDLEKIQ